jgi:dienelactone hydrolase
MLVKQWAFWPEREDFLDEFRRLLVSAQEGGATVAECFLAASRIDFKDDASWHREWNKLADISDERGQIAIRKGQASTARSNWLRALNYYQAAAFPFEATDEKYQAAVGRARACARDYLRHRRPPGEVVTIPWLSDHTLEGYFLPVNESHRSPVVICIGEPGHRKEEFLFKLGRHAADRGMSLLAVDLLGDRTGIDLEDLIRRDNPETAIHHVMEYLTGRDDVDPDRIAIYADGWGSSFVARGIAYDPRFAVAVCDGGLWHMHEWAYLARRQATIGSDSASIAGSRLIARQIACPILVTLGEQGWLRADNVAEMVGQLKTDGLDVTLKIFTGPETAAAQGHADNPTLANEFIFDWIVARLAHA